jgi:hypothetical protein
MPSKKRRGHKQKYSYKYVEPEPSYYNNSKYKLEISQSYIIEAGLGVFTNEFIPANSFIDNYTGDYSSRCFSNYYFRIREGVGIDALDYPRCYMGMLNDSHGTTYSNNCKFVVDLEKDTVSVWSIKDIQEGEELYISYGSEYWSW